MNEQDAFTLGVALAQALDEAGIPNALGGAIALAAWGIPRATVDVDINVFVEDEAMDRLFDVLESVLQTSVNRQQAMHEHRENGLIVLRSSGGLRVDVFTPSIEFSWEAAHTKQRQRILGADVWVLAPEALAVFKLMFFRSKDIADLERLVATQGQAMDLPLVRQRMADMMGEDDPRVTKWDELVRLFG
jgi:hypothetical protein